MSDRETIIKELDGLFDIETTCNYVGDNRHWADIVADYVISKCEEARQQGYDKGFAVGVVFKSVDENLKERKLKC